MTVKETPKRKSAGAVARLSPSAPKYVCIEPAQQPQVLDFLTDFGPELRESAMIHLRLCLHCRQLAETALKINEYLESGLGYHLHPDQDEVTTARQQGDSRAESEGDKGELCAQASEGNTEAEVSI